MAHVTRKEASKVGTFAAEVLRLLAMPGWTVLVMEQPAEEGTVARVQTIYGRYVVELYLCNGWMKLTSDERRDTVIHEMLHLLHLRVDHVFEDARDYMHDHEHDLLERRYRRETEYMVDHLAKFLGTAFKMEEAWDAAH